MEQYLTPMGPTKLHVNPIFETGPLEPRYAEYLVFEGARRRCVACGVRCALRAVLCVRPGVPPDGAAVRC